MMLFVYPIGDGYGYVSHKYDVCASGSCIFGTVSDTKIVISAKCNVRLGGRLFNQLWWRVDSLLFMSIIALAL